MSIERLAPLSTPRRVTEIDGSMQAAVGLRVLHHSRVDASLLVFDGARISRDRGLYAGPAESLGRGAEALGPVCPRFPSLTSPLPTLSRDLL
jgi:hypothetical protein